MKDIESIDDIQWLVDSFYELVRKDATLGPVFNEIIGDDWSVHLPIMYSFWQTILLEKPSYNGNPIKKHIEVDRRIHLETEHYTTWLQIWSKTINALFNGPIAENAKKRAEAMMGLIRMKVDMAREGKSLL